MSRHNLQGPVAHDRASLYAEITDKIIAELEAGHFPWVQPWGKTGTASALTFQVMPQPVGAILGSMS